MLIYFCIFMLLIAGVISSDMHRVRINKKALYLFCCFVLVTVASLAYKLGGDTYGMYNTWKQIPTFENFKFNELFDYNIEPFYLLLSVFVKTIFNDMKIMQIICILSVNIPVMYIFYKFSKYPFSCLLLYFLSQWQLNCFENMRQDCAILFYLLGCIFLIKDDLKKYLLYAWPMIFFHKSGILMFVLTIFLYRIRINKIAVWSVIGLFIVTMAFTSIFPEITNIINLYSSDMSEVYDNYMTSDKYGLGFTRNFYGTLVTVLVNMVIPLYLSYYYSQKGEKVIPNLVFLLSIFGAFINVFPVIGRFNLYLCYFFTILFFRFVYSNYRSKKLYFKTYLIMFFVCFNLYKNIDNQFSPNNSHYYRGADLRYYPYRSIFSSENDDIVKVRNKKLARPTYPLKK